MHECLRPQELPRRTALDEITGQGEGRAGEPDDRNGRRRPDETDALEDGGDGRRERKGVERGHLDLVADGLVDARTPTLFQVEGDADTLQGKHDVGEEDRRVHPELLDGPERHLGHQLRMPADLQQGVSLPQRAVFGLRPSGLAHEPHRRAIHGLEPAGAEEAVRADRDAHG